jgi:hypothetical protein
MLSRSLSALAVKVWSTSAHSECLWRQATLTARELLDVRTNSAVRTALWCRAVCCVLKYVKYAACVTLKLCVELLMRVVCGASDCHRDVAVWMSVAWSGPFAVCNRLTCRNIMWVFGPIIANLRTGMLRDTWSGWHLQDVLVRGGIIL